jgi:hypothetical protein
MAVYIIILSLYFSKYLKDWTIEDKLITIIKYD